MDARTSYHLAFKCLPRDLGDRRQRRLVEEDELRLSPDIVGLGAISVFYLLHKVHLFRCAYVLLFLCRNYVFFFYIKFYSKSSLNIIFAFCQFSRDV